MISEKLLQAPDPEIFNAGAINPTIEVYVGDCEDIDQNGILDMAELIACGRKEAPEEEGEGKREKKRVAILTKDVLTRVLQLLVGEGLRVEQGL